MRYKNSIFVCVISYLYIKYVFDYEPKPVDLIELDFQSHKDLKMLSDYNLDRILLMLDKIAYLCLFFQDWHNSISWTGNKTSYIFNWPSELSETFWIMLKNFPIDRNVGYIDDHSKLNKWLKVRSTYNQRTLTAQ